MFYYISRLPTPISRPTVINLMPDTTSTLATLYNFTKNPFDPSPPTLARGAADHQLGASRHGAALTARLLKAQTRGLLRELSGGIV